MKRSRLSASALALTLLASVAVPVLPALAQTSAAPAAKMTAPEGTEQTAAAKPDASQPSEMMPFKLSRDAAFGLREVRVAQQALHAGDTEAAASLLDEAKTSFQAADADAITLDQLPSKAADQTDGALYYAVGAQTTIREDLSSQPAKQQAVADANRQVQAGDHAAARETLRVNEIDLTTVVALLPKDATLQALDEAIDLIGQDKAQDAATTLASIEQGLIVEGMGLHGVPSDEATSTQSGSLSPTQQQPGMTQDDATQTGSVSPAQRQPGAAQDEATQTAHTSAMPQPATDGTATATN